MSIDLGRYPLYTCSTCGQPIHFTGAYSPHYRDPRGYWATMLYVCPNGHYWDVMSTPETDPYYGHNHPGKPPTFPLK